MNQSDKINLNTMSIFGDIQELNPKGINLLMKEYFQNTNIFKTLLGEKEELQAIKDTECSHNVKIFKNGKWVCGKCYIEYESEVMK